MTDEELTDGLVPEGPVSDTRPTRRKILMAVLIGAGALLLAGGLGVVGYSAYARLAQALEGLQTAYTAEQTTARELGQKAEGLSTALDQAQTRVKALEASHKASEEERGKQEARSARLETAVQGLQTASTAEQASAKKLAEKADELSKAMEQIRARLKAREEQPGDLVQLNHALGLSYSKRGMNEDAVKAFQTALKFDPNHAEAHFELARLYIGHFDDKKSGAFHLRRYLQQKPTAKESERVKGWLMKVDKELQADKERKDWGTPDVNRGLQRIFD
jgi:tetratricopeptide (TPR) repeat protein